MPVTYIDARSDNEIRIKLSETPSFQTLTENRQWWCWCRLFRQGDPDRHGTSNWEDPTADCWEPDGWYGSGTNIP